MFQIDNFINPAAATVLVVLILATSGLILIFGIRAQDERKRRRLVSEAQVAEQSRRNRDVITIEGPKRHEGS